MSYQPTIQRTTNTPAVLSLVFGICAWVLLPVIGAIVAIVCGHMARGEIRRASPGSMDGDGMAIAGLVLGYAQLAFTVASVVFVVAFLVFGFGLGAGFLHSFAH